MSLVGVRDIIGTTRENSSIYEAIYLERELCQEPEYRTIVTYSKSENIAGLQFADFVAYNIIKLEGCKVKEQITDFMKQIHRMAYNGGHSISEIDQRSFWGMRVLPSYLRMEELLSENKTLRNSYANLKKARNKQKRIIDAQKEKIAQLEEENKRLLDLIKSIDIKKES